VAAGITCTCGSDACLSVFQDIGYIDGAVRSGEAPAKQNLAEESVKDGSRAQLI